MEHIWRDLPAWVQAIGSSLSVLLALYILLLDRREKQTSHAAEVSCWEEVQTVLDFSGKVREVKGLALVTNSSKWPITNLGLLQRTMRPSEVRRYVRGPYRNRARALARQPVHLSDSGFTAAESGRIVTVLQPDETVTCALQFHGRDRQVDDDSLLAVRRWVFFVDCRGRAWYRDLNDGALLRANSLRAKRILRGGVGWCFPRRRSTRMAFRSWLQT